MWCNEKQYDSRKMLLVGLQSLIRKTFCGLRQKETLEYPPNDTLEFMESSLLPYPISSHKQAYFR